MKQEEKKPREWALAEGYVPQKLTELWSFDEAKTYFQQYEGQNPTHVIEYSAYEDLKAKLEKAKRTLEHYSCSYQQVISTGTDLARAALKEIE